MKRPAVLPRSTYQPHKPRKAIVRHPKNPSRGVSGWLKNLVLALLVLVVGLLLLIGLGSWALSQIEPLDKDLNVVFISPQKTEHHKKVTFVHFSAAQKSAKVVTLPAELPVQVLGGYGQYSLNAVVPLLKIEHKDPTYVRAALSHGLGRAIDKVMLTGSSVEMSTGADLSRLLFQTLKEVPLRRNAWRDVLQLYLFTNQLKSAEIDVTVASDQITWDKVVATLAKQTAHAECPISVINTTQVSGLAGQFSTLEEKSNLTVIKSGDTQEVLDQTKIYLAKDQTCQEVISIVQATLPMIVTPEVNPTLTNQYRSELVLLLGNDVAELLESAR